MPEPTEVRPMKNRVCPICDGARVRHLYTQRFFPMSDGSLLDGFDVVVCDACGLAYSDDIPPQSVFDAYYRDMSKYEFEGSGGQESAHDFKRFHSIAELISRHVPNRNTAILDIGCATGGLLSVLKGMGYTNLRGLDPSPRCAAAAKRLYGIEVMDCTISDLLGRPERFDLLILVGVLEHIRDLHGAMASMTGLIAPGGAVFGEVPDATEFHRWPDAPFQEFSTEHINHFSPVSLANLFARRGLAEVVREQHPRWYTASTVMPSAVGIYRKSGDSQSLPIRRDDQSEPALREYIRQSLEVERRIESRIEQISQGGQPILVWGVGTHTQRLMARGSLGNASIVAFVDSNPRYQGKTLNGVPILSPGDLRNRPEPIVISSRVFEQDIARQIKETLKLPNEVVLLYNL